MNTEETIQKLIKLKLTTVAAALRELQSAAPNHELSFEEKIGMLVDREWTERDNRRLARRLKEAKLGVRASLEDAVCDASRGLEKATGRDSVRLNPKPQADHLPPDGGAAQRQHVGVVHEPVADRVGDCRIAEPTRRFAPVTRSDPPEWEIKSGWIR